RGSSTYGVAVGRRPVKCGGIGQGVVSLSSGAVLGSLVSLSSSAGPSCSSLAPSSLEALWDTGGGVVDPVRGRASSPPSDRLVGGRTSSPPADGFAGLGVWLPRVPFMTSVAKGPSAALSAFAAFANASLSSGAATKVRVRARLPVNTTSVRTTSPTSG